jgi:hypothetical protein
VDTADTWRRETRACERRTQRGRPVRPSRLGDVVSDVEIRIDAFAAFRDARGHRGQLRLIPHHLFSDLDANAHLARINVDETHVLARLRARATNTLAISRVERRVEFATKGIEPRSRRLKVLDGAESLQRRQRR